MQYVCLEDNHHRNPPASFLSSCPSFVWVCVCVWVFPLSLQVIVINRSLLKAKSLIDDRTRAMNIIMIFFYLIWIHKRVDDDAMSQEGYDKRASARCAAKTNALTTRLVNVSTQLANGKNVFTLMGKLINSPSIWFVSKTKLIKRKRINEVDYYIIQHLA